MLDLHMHSLYSDDGEFTPAELVQRCAAAGITLMSITDHNCARANADAAPLAARCGITYLPGIEIDCCHAGLNFHVLGYGIDSGSDDFAQIEQNVICQSEAASLAMLEATQTLGFAVTESDMCRAAQGKRLPQCWTGELFAEVLLHDPRYAAHPLLRPYRPGGARADNPYVNFYWDLYAQGKPCYYPMQYPTVAQVIEILHKNGGAAVLAHPGVNLKGHEALFGELCRLGLDGVEAYSSYHTPAVRDFYLEQARVQGMFCTGGSDFHGKTKPAVQLGGIGGDPDETVMLQNLRRAMR